MGFWKNEESSTNGNQPQAKERRWTEDEEFSSELVQDHIFKCYDREER